MHTKDIETAIDLVAHPKAQIIRTKARSQLNEILNRIVNLETAREFHCSHCGEFRKIFENQGDMVCENCFSVIASFRVTAAHGQEKENGST